MFCSQNLHAENKIDPKATNYGSKKKVWWNCKKCKYIYDTHHSGVRDWDENVTKDEKCPSADTMEQNNAGWNYVTYQGEDTKLCDECVEETRTSAIAAANELKAAGNNTLFNLNNVSSASIANN